jgi:hypothetical protein
MKSWTRKVVATGEISDAMGADPIGYIAYHADGRMMATVFSRSRGSFNGPKPTADDKVRLFDSMLAYVARYTLEDDKVVHHVEAAWNPGWQVDLVRPFKLDGNRLIISDAPSRDPLTGEEVVYRLEFEKITSRADTSLFGEHSEAASDVRTFRPSTK